METALRRLRNQVGSWKDGLDTTLLFIALFSAIVTAFLNQVIQNLTPSPGQNTDELLGSLIEVVVQIATLNGLKTPSIPEPEPFEAAHSDELSAFFWYSSLIVSILCAGPAVLARLQMLSIEEAPKGEKHIEKVMRLRDREQMAKWFLTPTLEALPWSLAIAIALFMAGLFSQMWNLHSSIPGPLLWASGILGATLASIVAAFVILAAIHAMLYEESPFGTSVSKTLRSFLWKKGHFQEVWVALRRGDLKRDLLDVPKWHPGYFRFVRNLFPLYSEPPYSIAAYQFCDLVSQCADPEQLNHAAPVLVECFDHIDFKVARFQDNVEPAIRRILNSDTSDETKLTILKNIPRLKKSVISECKQLVDVLPGVILRIQEENADRSPAIRKAALHAIIHLIDQPEEFKDHVVAPRSDNDCIVRGLQDCDPIHDPKKEHLVSWAFLSALLEFDYLPPEVQRSVLETIPTEIFLAAYVMSMYWAYKELGVRDHRARYREILGQSFRPQMLEIISSQKGTSNAELLVRLAPFISNLDSMISLDPEQGERAKRAVSAVAAILYSIRLKQKDFPTVLPPLKLAAFAKVLLPFDVELKLSQSSVNLKDTQRYVKTRVPKRLDLNALKQLEVLAWFIDHCQPDLGSLSTGSPVLQFLVDCHQLEMDPAWGHSSFFAFFNKLQSHVTSALTQISSNLRLPPASWDQVDQAAFESTDAEPPQDVHRKRRPWAGRARHLSGASYLPEIEDHSEKYESSEGSIAPPMLGVSALLRVRQAFRLRTQSASTNVELGSP
ncbi:hypothetical protein SISSUDRAFT_1121406 [Sistotremastrum suecicum HHB10207 ss-3]|uniref:DUF6535 domain-containing protein n=1 Tax=Sistotremastrum suecicum HHB10207 ss-3 TaxID=1314776 RepID=A0A166AWF6_9AGAM|nr:hypothetical protein SISSUDRAFT_1121406 [Sistotremastrum suecicum HHB10207 ss-3]